MRHIHGRNAKLMIKFIPRALGTRALAMGFPKGREQFSPLVACGVYTPLAKTGLIQRSISDACILSNCPHSWIFFTFKETPHKSQT